MERIAKGLLRGIGRNAIGRVAESAYDELSLGEFFAWALSELVVKDFIASSAKGVTNVDMQNSFSVFTEVELLHSVVVDGHTVPKGARGVVMAAYEDGLAYEVEFEAPAHVVLTLEHDALRALTHAFV